MLSISRVRVQKFDDANILKYHVSILRLDEGKGEGGGGGGGGATGSLYPARAPNVLSSSEHVKSQH